MLDTDTNPAQLHKIKNRILNLDITKIINSLLVADTDFN